MCIQTLPHSCRHECHAGYKTRQHPAGSLACMERCSHEDVRRAKCVLYLYYITSLAIVALLACHVCAGLPRVVNPFLRVVWHLGPIDGVARPRKVDMMRYFKLFFLVTIFIILCLVWKCQCPYQCSQGCWSLPWGDHRTMPVCRSG